MIKAALAYFETADRACKDVSRFFNGNTESQCLYNNGKCILYFIVDIYKQMKAEKGNGDIKRQCQELCFNANTYNDYTRYIDKVLFYEDTSIGNRHTLLCKIAGYCKKHYFSTDALYYANSFVGLEDKEFNNIVKLYYK